MKSNGHTVIESDPVDTFNLDLTPPITPIQKFGDGRVRYKGKKYEFYKSCNWIKFWDEFNSSISKSGKLTYRNAYNFARKKGITPFKTEVIYACIGPSPISQLDGTIEVPWLGDWQKRRSQGFAWALANPDNLRSLQQVIKERRDTLEAAKALAPLTAGQIARFARLSEKIDEAYGGEPFLVDEPPDSEKNQARFHAYLAMHKQVNEVIKELSKQWFMAHGLDVSNTEQWMQMFGAAVAGGMVGAVGTKTLKAESDDEPNSTDLLVARALIQKAKIYQLADKTVTIDADPASTAKQ